MLEPYSRSLLLDLLRPPEGFRLEAGIGTTYSLDLVSLLVAPFAFSSFDAQPEDGPKASSLEVLNGLHQYAERLTVFCQQGRIGVPRARYPQLAYLERSVIECRSPRGGSFHPKIWLLRFERSPEEVVYRLLCLSRNLTFDRSWDTVLTLEGPLLARRNAIARNHPLGDFIRALPQMAARQPVPPVVRERVNHLQDEVRRVDFVLPEGFSECRFWPIGIEGRPRWPFGDTGKRMLVISPFVSRGRLEQLAKGRAGNLLVSTEPALRAMGGKPDGYLRAYFLNENAKPESEPDLGEEAGDGEPEAMPGDLHAKCYIADAGALAHVWTGSANATAAAFHSNVEFMVELVGPKRLFGIDSLMVHEKDTTRLADLLQEAPDAMEPENDQEDQELLALLDRAREALLGAGVRAVVHAPVEDRFDVELRATTTPVLPPGVTVVAWPVTVPRASHERPLTSGEAVAPVFPGLSFEALTAFYAFELTAAVGMRVQREAFVQNLPTDGLPADRTERLLRLVIRDQNRFVQFLLLLLGVEDQSLAGGTGAVGKGQEAGPAPSLLGGQPLLETLVRALERNPERLDQVARLVAEVTASPEGQEVLPASFNEIWAPICAARQRMLHGVTGSAS